MGKVNNQQRVITCSILFLFGIVVLSSLFIVPGYTYYGGPQKLPDSHLFILSEESPSYVYNPHASDIGISSLQTNDTPVSIVIRHQDQVVFNATNIIEISDYDIEIPVSSPYEWQLEIVRQDADVSIELTTYQWVTAVAYVMTPPFLIFAIAGIGIALYALYLMFNSYRGISSDEQKGAKFLAIIVLMLLGTLFCYPLANGHFRGNFTPVTTFTSLSDENYQFSLNETHPSSSLDLSLLHPEEESSVSINIHSINSSDYPLQLSVITDNIYNLTLEEVSNDADWWITIPIEVNSTSVVSFERFNTDLDVEFRVERQIQTIVPREDIAIPVIFGILGISAIIGGLFIAYRIEALY